MDEPDIPQGRPLFVPPTGTATEGGGPDDDANAGGGRGRGGAAGPQPRVILRFADEKDLLVSGMLTGGQRVGGASGGDRLSVGQGACADVRE